MATVLVAIQELKQSKSTLPQGSAKKVEEVVSACNWDFAFVMLCSGHLGACPDAHGIVSSAAPLHTPSLHVFGASGVDSQVEHDASLDLFHTFTGGQAIVHSKGHVIPSARADVNGYTTFFAQAVQR